MSIGDVACRHQIGDPLLNGTRHSASTLRWLDTLWGSCQACSLGLLEYVQGLIGVNGVIS